MSNLVKRGIASVRTRLGAAIRRVQAPRVGSIDFGDLRRVTPVSRVFGLDRGTPVDRYYIEGFLERNGMLVRGRVLEIAEATYTRRFGGDRVAHSEILHATGEGGGETIVADLTCAPQIPDDTFDCIILTQTLHYTFKLKEMVSEVHRVLAPGGSVLCTVPGISQISRYDMDRWGDYWRLTTRSARELFETSFTPEEIEVTSHGNVLSSAAFLYGLASSEITQAELDADDEDYQLVVTVRATKKRPA